MIKKELVKEGINGNLSEAELESLLNDKLERSDYYDYETYRRIIKKMINHDNTDSYFKLWCMLVARSLTQKKYEKLSYAFDGLAFSTKFSDKSLNEILIHLMNYNYDLTCKNIIGSFEKNKDYVRYLIFETSNMSQNSVIYKTIIVDYLNKKFDIKIIDDANYTYDETKIYYFIEEYSESDYGNLDFSKQYKQIEKVLYDRNNPYTIDHSLEF